MNIIIFGPPGAGKGTQAEFLIKDYGLNHIASGDITRCLFGDKVLGEKLKGYVDAGKLIPNNIIIPLVEKYLSGKMDGNGLLFDGYPRNTGQAKALDRFAKKNKMAIDVVINLKLNEDESLKRILLRGQTSERSDDNAETIKNRLKVYREKTAPILDYYREQGRLKNIDGAQTIEQVAGDIKKLLKTL